jgi:hypothetical protein
VRERGTEREGSTDIREAAVSDGATEAAEREEPEGDAEEMIEAEVEQLADEPVCVWLRGKLLQEVNAFKYLGSWASKDGGMSTDVTARVRGMYAAFGALKMRVFRNKELTMACKLEVFNAMVLSIGLYGSATWNLSVAEIRKLEAVNLRLLRGIIPGATGMSPLEDLILLAAEQGSLVRSFECRVFQTCLQYLGHMERMSEGDVQKLAVQCDAASGTRNSGGQRLSYQAAVGRAMKAFGINGAEWEALAGDKNEWRRRTLVEGPLHYMKAHLRGQAIDRAERRRVQRAADQPRIDALVAAWEKGLDTQRWLEFFPEDDEERNEEPERNTQDSRGRTGNDEVDATGEGTGNQEEEADVAERAPIGQAWSTQDEGGERVHEDEEEEGEIHRDDDEEEFDLRRETDDDSSDEVEYGPDGQQDESVPVKNAMKVYGIWSKLFRRKMQVNQEGAGQGGERRGQSVVAGDVQRRRERAVARDGRAQQRDGMNHEVHDGGSEGGDVEAQGQHAWRRRVRGSQEMRGTRGVEEAARGGPTASVMQGCTGGQVGGAAAGGQTMVPARESANVPAEELDDGPGVWDIIRVHQAERAARIAGEEARSEARREARRRQGVNGGVHNRVIQEPRVAAAEGSSEARRGGSACAMIGSAGYQGDLGSVGGFTTESAREPSRERERGPDGRLAEGRARSLAAGVSETDEATAVNRDAGPARGVDQYRREVRGEENTGRADVMEVEDEGSGRQEGTGTGEQEDGGEMNTQESDTERPHKKRRKQKKGKSQRRAARAHNDTQDGGEVV